MVKTRCKPEQLKAMEVSLDDARIRSHYLEEAINSISDAFVLYDGDGKLILCNQKHLEFYSHLADVYRPGAKREDIWRHHALKICESDPTIDVEAYLETRRNETGLLRPDAERQLIDGRWVSARERSIMGGGTVAIRTDITDVKNMMADLEKKSCEAIKSTRKLRRAKSSQNDTYEHLLLSLNSMRNGFVIWDAKDRLVLANDAYKGFHNPIRHMIKKGLIFKDMLSAGFDNEIWNTSGLNKHKWLQQQLAKRRRAKESHKELKLADGTQLIFYERILDNDEVITTITDVTAQREHENDLEETKNQLEGQVRELKKMKALLEEASNTANNMAHDLRQARDIQRDAIDNISDGFVLWDKDDRLIMCNSMFKFIYSELDDILSTGLRFEDFVRALYQRKIYESFEENVEQGIEKRISRHRVEDSPVEERLSDNRWIRINKRPASDGRIVGIVTDITAQKQSENAIKKLAETDVLTGLPNRALFNKRLQTAIINAKRSGLGVGLLLLDLDHFKLINDTLGHPVGDALLCEVALRIQKTARKSNTVARLGGDEFVIIVPDIEDRSDVCHFADRLGSLLANPYYLEDQKVHTSASIGISIYSSNSGGSDELFRDADIALYKAKEAGRGGYKLFDHRMRKSVTVRSSIEQELREAISCKQLELHYQPQIDVSTGHITGAEALLRWPTSKRTVMSPDQFIPIAESTGLIEPLCKWVLNTACHQAQKWQNDGLPPITIAVNISPMQFKHQRLIGIIGEALEQSQLEPKWLELEITEGVAMESSSASIFAEIKKLGIKMAIDDFGTGYSSLSQLMNFPVNRIKIDRSFIKFHKNRKFCSAIVNLGQSLNLDIIAEGVETLQELEALSKMGCNEMQGFVFAPALPAKTFVEFIRAHNPNQYVNDNAQTKLKLVK